MGKNQKYDLDLLLDAVFQYADVTHKKIKATELAKWASDNIPGLEGVEDRIFLRPYTIMENGSKKIVPKPCTLKIQEINAVRQVKQAIKQNILLSSVNIDAFFQLHRPEQREQILDARKHVEQLQKDFAANERKIKQLEKVIEQLKADLARHEASEATQMTDTRLQKIELQLSHMIKHANDEQMRDLLETIGVENDGFDLQKYIQSLTQDQDNEFEFEQSKSVTKLDLMSGINF